MTVCQFTSRGDIEWYVVVGTARDLTLAPRTSSGGSLILFRMSLDGTKLEHVHSVSQHTHTHTHSHYTTNINTCTYSSTVDTTG